MNRRYKALIKTAIIVLLIILVIVNFSGILSLLKRAVGIFLPFLLGYIFSLALNPVSKLLSKRFKLTKQLSAIIVILLAVGVIGTIFGSLIYKMVEEIKSIYENLPALSVEFMLRWRELTGKLSNLLSALPQSGQQIIKDMGEGVLAAVNDLINTNYKPIFSAAGNFAKRLPGIFIFVIVFVLSLYFMISDSKKINGSLKKIMSPDFLEKISLLKKEIKRYIGGYVKAQLIIMTVAFTILLIGLNILDVEYSLIIAFGTALLDALPFFGSGAVLVTWAVVSLLTQDLIRAVGLIIIYLCIVLTRQLIEPKIVSTHIGLSPILTLMTMYVGYKTFSIGGMILGPLVMMLIISLYRAGLFDTFIKIGKRIYKNMKTEMQNLLDEGN